MAFVEQAHVNDIGVIFRVTVYDTNSTTFERVAVFTNTGSDGLIQYATVDGDLNGPGTWHLQALVTTPDGTFNTSVGYFKVNENL